MLRLVLMRPVMATLYTIGHSTRTLNELVAALKAHGVRMLADIRSFPMSRRLPHFNRESLEVELPKSGIAYVWMKELGGRRKKIRNDSPNTSLRNDSFRNYADYMLTADFAQGIERLLEIAQQRSGSPRRDRGRFLDFAWDVKYRYHVRRARVLPMPSHAGERLPYGTRPHCLTH